MTTPFARGMTRATELTQAGKLDEATALIQSLLQPATTPPVRSPDAPVDTMNTLEGSFTRLDTTAQPASRPARPTRMPRKSLKETLRDIAAGGMAGKGAVVPAQVDVPDGAQFLSLAYSGPHGSRDYRLYIPANRPAHNAPLVVMLHGCTQSPEDFAIGTGMNALAEEFGCLIAYPAQPNGANAQKCWNWFRPQDQGKGKGEPAVIAGIVGDVLRTHGADAGRVYVAGLSAGGAAAAIMGAAYPDVFAAIGVHSGLPARSAQDVASAFGAMRNGSRGAGIGPGVPVIVFHGSADTTVHPANGAGVVAQAVQAQSGLTETSATGMSGSGRKYRHTRHDDATGRTIAEHWVIDGAGHAWAGGDARASYTDPTGPDASREMLRFFLQHAK